MATKTKSKQDAQEAKLQLHELRAKLEAINKVQAVIEFNMDGTIITANDNFYSLDEIQGKHHRIFADPIYINSVEYQQFREKLNQGIYDSGEYKRIGKGGKEVWIQASYNPIFDLNGKPYKIVKYATDVTAQRPSQRPAPRAYASTSRWAGSSQPVSAKARRVKRQCS